MFRLSFGWHVVTGMDFCSSEMNPNSTVLLSHSIHISISKYGYKNAGSTSNFSHIKLKSSIKYKTMPMIMMYMLISIATGLNLSAKCTPVSCKYPLGHSLIKSFWISYIQVYHRIVNFKTVCNFFLRNLDQSDTIMTSYNNIPTCWKVG